jgi:hypothetical protein
MLNLLVCLAVVVQPEPPPLKGVVIVVDPGHGGQRFSKSYTGETSDRKYHDLLVAMKLYDIANEVKLPKAP